MVTKTLINENLMNENVTLSNYAFNKNNNASNILPMNFSENTSISSFSNKLGKQNNSPEQTSPYLNCTKVHIISKTTEKKIFQKKPNDITSSFSQAYKIYKTNSDEFKANKCKSKKDKSSRLLVSKELTNGQQTVSDMNESEYHNRVDNNRRCKRKRRPAKFGRPNLEEKKFEFYNGDLICCPTISDKKQLNQDKRINSKMQKINGTRKRGEIVQPGDLWAILRNINKFPYITSPRLSEDSIETIKRKGNYTKNQKETGLIETCTTEEFSYISSYDIKSKPQSVCSKPSSLDRVTIVNQGIKSRKGDANIKELTKLPVANVRSSRISKKNAIKHRCNKQKVNKKNIQPPDISGIENKAETFVNSQPSGLLKIPYSDQRPNEVEDGYIELIDDTNSEDETLTEKKLEYVQNDTSMEDNRYIDSNVFVSSIPSKAVLKNVPEVKIIDKNKNTLDNKGNSMKENRFHSKLPNNQRQYGFPKLTQTEIKRRLVNLKYPIVILGKDELSSTFRIVDYDPPHYDSLNRHVWPYMKEWILDSKINKIESKGNKVLENQNKYSVSPKHQYEPPRKDCLNEIANRKPLHNFTGNAMHGAVSKKKESKTNFHGKDNVNPYKPAPQKKKVLNQFKDKMIDLIYNKPQRNLGPKNVINNNRSNVLRPMKHNIESKIHLEPIRGVEFKELCENTSHFNKPQSNKYPWSKAKWASDFIDNIIKKIKKGMYYTQHDIDNENIHSGTEVIIPVPKVETIPEDENVNQDVFTSETETSTIPGFDDNHNVMPLKVDVKMITSTLVSVHHSLTNVMLQFDICIPSVSESSLNSKLPSFSSVLAPENKSMLFKCQDRIQNGMLPAQLCSILPKFLFQIMKDKSFTEMPHSPFNVETNQIIPRIIFYPFIQFSWELQRLMTGKFPKKGRSDKDQRIDPISSNLDWCNNILINKVETKRLINFSPTLRNYLKFQLETISHITNDQRLPIKPMINTCTAMMPYTPPFTTISHALGLNNLGKIISGMNNFMLGVSRWNKKLIPVNCCIEISDELRQTLNTIPKFSISLSICKLPYERMKEVDTTFETRIPKYDKGGHEVVKKCVKKTFVKLHKKCKSLTNMSKESCATSLNKITNLDDFFHALGCYKSLSKVLMGHSDKAILSSITEMKSWIKEITQSQALLILLLSNKKETRNLKRFRPMLLQGIAVNRITTAAELDMEIEVIEKENLCISQNEGISFLSQSNENGLLDELCWIAKTTASDYQKPFDDSSEKLIKSLLGKRKKLNPSYLRVMARYVGLGLLKHRNI